MPRASRPRSGGCLVVRVKFCGLTRAVDIVRAQELGVDFIGFNFYPPSPRHVPADGLEELLAAVRGPVRVGVFVNAGLPEIAVARTRFSLGAVQLHGDETPDFCRRARRRLGVPVIRAIGVNEPQALETARAYLSAADYLLLDAGGAGQGDGVRGGTGRTICWDLAARIAALGRPVFLAGGLTPENVARAVALVSPFGVDVAGGIEVSPGVKSGERMAGFMAALGRGRRLSD